MIIRETHLVPEGVPPTRLSDYARTAFTLLVSRKAAVKAIKRGEIKIEGKTGVTGDWIQTGQCLQLLDLHRTPPKPFRLPLEIVFEDDFLAVINKPPGIEVSGNKFKTLENALSGSLKSSAHPEALPWARPVHRLDYSTSGLLMAAKTAGALVSLSDQFEHHTIHKRYSAVVVGKPPAAGQIRSPIDGRPSLSAFTTIQTVASLRNDRISLLHLFPHTGRTHQLRIHLVSIGHPIVGDHKYGPEGKVLRGKGLFLAATQLEFLHPQTSEKMNISIDDPAKFASYMKREDRRWTKLR